MNIISFDLLSMVFGLLMPFWFTFSVLIALALGKRFETFVMGDYVRETVERNNELMIQNKELRKKLKGDDEND